MDYAASPSSRKEPEAITADVGSTCWNADLHVSSFVSRTYAGKFASNFFRAFRHASKSPVTIRLIRLPDICIEAAAIVTATEPELSTPIIEFHDDSRCLRMAEGICKGLTGDAKDFLHNVPLESIASSLAFHDKPDSGGAIHIAGEALYRIP